MSASEFEPSLVFENSLRSSMNIKVYTGTLKKLQYASFRRLDSLTSFVLKSAKDALSRFTSNKLYIQQNVESF